MFFTILSRGLQAKRCQLSSISPGVVSSLKPQRSYLGLRKLHQPSILPRPYSPCCCCQFSITRLPQTIVFALGLSNPSLRPLARCRIVQLIVICDRRRPSRISLDKRSAIYKYWRAWYHSASPMSRRALEIKKPRNL